MIFTFTCSDHSIVIEADTEELALETLKKILDRGSEEIYTINDYKIEELNDTNPY